MQTVRAYKSCIRPGAGDDVRNERKQRGSLNPGPYQRTAGNDVGISLKKKFHHNGSRPQRQNRSSPLAYPLQIRSETHNLAGLQILAQRYRLCQATTGVGQSHLQAPTQKTICDEGGTQLL